MYLLCITEDSEGTEHAAWQVCPPGVRGSHPTRGRPAWQLLHRVYTGMCL